ncbi:hypothetical protein COO60DRAFT_1481893 [Scenedesmus sp. NREL 46B-D3]|nr:hypothetical protein COO60DRAFT_1481893 [Scenedesmus sp. NREL 46B-D3]
MLLLPSAWCSRFSFVAGLLLVFLHTLCRVQIMLPALLQMRPAQPPTHCSNRLPGYRNCHVPCTCLTTVRPWCRLRLCCCCADAAGHAWHAPSRLWAARGMRPGMPPPGMPPPGMPPGSRPPQ